MLKLIGAGLPRTATSSLRSALPTLLGGNCYHMTQVFANPSDIDVWISALRNETVDWDALFTGYTAAVDWPASALWPEIAEQYPDAIILLSTRSSAQAWYRSMSDTILRARHQAQMADSSVMPSNHSEMFRLLWDRIIDCDQEDAEACQHAYDTYVQKVRDTAPAERLVEWDATQGWEPLCRALDVPVPDMPFPRLNTTEEFQQITEQMSQVKDVNELREAASQRFK